MRILVVGGNRVLTDFLCKGIKESGHVGLRAVDGPDALLLARSESYDAIVLDRWLPGMDGLAIRAALRDSGSAVPTMMIYTQEQIDEQILDLLAGGDDFLVKPFAIAELLARLEMLVYHRRDTGTDRHLRVADLELDPLAHSVRRDGTAITLQPQEYRVLKFLMRHAGQIVTRTMLLEGAWGDHFEPRTNVVDVHLSRLRAKVDKPPAKTLIHTLRGAGYCLCEPEALCG